MLVLGRFSLLTTPSPNPAKKTWLCRRAHLHVMSGVAVGWHAVRQRNGDSPGLARRTCEAQHSAYGGQASDAPRSSHTKSASAGRQENDT